MGGCVWVGGGSEKNLGTLRGGRWVGVRGGGERRGVENEMCRHEYAEFSLKFTSHPFPLPSPPSPFALSPPRFSHARILSVSPPSIPSPCPTCAPPPPPGTRLPTTPCTGCRWCRTSPSTERWVGGGLRKGGRVWGKGEVACTVRRRPLCEGEGRGGIGGGRGSADGGKGEGWEVKEGEAGFGPKRMYCCRHDASSGHTE